MTRRLAVLALFALAACGPAPQSAPPASEPRVVAPAAASQPPAKPAHMICRNSQTGAKAKCGTPNAVMVGVAEEAAPVR